MYKHIARVGRQVPVEIEQRLGRIDTATLSDTMGRNGAMTYRMRPLDIGTRLVGSALTVQCSRGDNLMVHQALQLARPGDVLVIDTGQTYEATVMGRNMCLFAHRVGVAGAVIDGTVRDRSGILAIPFPVFAMGLTPRSAVKQTGGSIDVPILCGGIVVQPGDIVVGDEDGVVVVPHEQAAEVADQAEERLRMEDKQMKDVQGEDLPLEILYGRTWVGERLDAGDGEPFQIKSIRNTQ